MRSFTVGVFLFVIVAALLGADAAAVTRGLIVGLAFGMLTVWHLGYRSGWNDRVETEKDETIDRAEARAEDARR